MKTTIFKILFLSAVVFSSCKKSGSPVVDQNASDDIGNAGQESGQGGVMTGAEWNDLENWSFWNEVSSKSEYASKLTKWNMNTKNRISVELVDSMGRPVVDAIVQLKKSGTVVFTSHTDNRGKAELWVNLFQSASAADYSQYQINVNHGVKIIENIKSYSSGVNTIVMPSRNTLDDKVEIAFVVDATSSMGDELKYLKNELYDVIARIKSNNVGSEVQTSSIFYRDEADDYVTKESNFTTEESTTVNFIKNQEAAGGGDLPEAVHTALDKLVNSMTWSSSAKTRIAFLILDAPPHYSSSILSSLQRSIAKANELGIKIIPIAASGVDKETEFLMRTFAISTNATYVFLTNDSGIGKDHSVPTVGTYKVEYLNNLMVRLVNFYSK